MFPKWGFALYLSQKNKRNLPEMDKYKTSKNNDTQPNKTTKEIKLGHV